MSFIYTSCVRYILHLGANEKSRLFRILNALEGLSEFGSFLQVSRVYLTEPVGPSWGWFLNVALEFETRLSPVELLDLAKSIERELGRRKTIRWGPRPIDVDLLLWSEGNFFSKNLVIPHPRVWERAFVLFPLLDLDLSAYGLKRKKILFALSQLKDREKVIPLYSATEYLYLKIRAGG